MSLVRFNPIKNIISSTAVLNVSPQRSYRAQLQTQPDAFEVRFGKKTTQASQPSDSGKMTELERHVFQLAGFYPEDNVAQAPVEDIHYCYLRSQVLNVVTEKLDPSIPILSFFSGDIGQESESDRYLGACAHYAQPENLPLLAKALGLPEQATFDDIEKVVVRLTQFNADVSQAKIHIREKYIEALSQKTGIPLEEVRRNTEKAKLKLSLGGFPSQELIEIYQTLRPVETLRQEIDTLKQSCTTQFAKDGITLPDHLLDKLQSQVIWLG